ncbi:TlpA disulfide reductase family protein [Clostridium sp. A1-XYC3]|uniref:TlpA disulfide reductase family protein n=1 Tax=Clostridium tanneri TaxID=3037988 RepID=A0ABU4JXK2_9CLOT|nr:TlpA disulfide reductase family protein [Clostridium sp. A1-XYC3]MDW8802899.1 TlpA disulfide reductase family protein [Clostridium sp. A1-XYC3]
MNFFATWCPPCKEEMPDLEKLYQETKNSDLVILAISGGEDKATVENFVKENNYNFKVLLDPDGVANISYNISSIPTSYFIDENGNIVNKRTGLMTLNQMKTYVENIK